MFLIMMNNCAYVLLTMNSSTYIFSINYEHLKIMSLLIMNRSTKFISIKNSSTYFFDQFKIMLLISNCNHISSIMNISKVVFVFES